MPFRQKTRPTHKDILEIVFKNCHGDIQRKLGRSNLSLNENIGFETDLIDDMVKEFLSLRARLNDLHLWEKHGPAAGTLYTVTHVIMAHKPVTVPLFDVEKRELGRQVANTVYAINAALTYLRMSAGHDAAVTDRLWTYVMSGGVSMLHEANLVAFRAFLNAYARKTFFLAGGYRLRDHRSMM